MRRVYNIISGWFRKNGFRTSRFQNCLHSKKSEAIYNYRLYSKEGYTIEDGVIEIKTRDEERKLIGVFVYSYTYNLKKIQTQFTALDEMVTPLLIQLSTYLSELEDKK